MLAPQFSNYTESSFALWLEHQILVKGSGFQNVSTYFYPIGQQYGHYVYAAPYQPLLADTSISSNYPSGIYLSGSFVNVNESGFLGYDLKRGRAYFNNYVGNNTKVSGNYNICDINILNLDISEEKLLFETKFELRKPNSLSISGLAKDSYTYPSIYIKNFAESSEPYSFGGEDLSEVNIGLFLICENNYQLTSLRSILASSKQELVPFLTNFPYNYLGNYKVSGENYNYTNWVNGALSSGDYLYIKDVTVNSFNRQYNVDFNKLNSNVFFAVADVVLSKSRFPRSTTNNL